MLATGFLRRIKLLFAAMANRSVKGRRLSATTTYAPVPNMT